MRRLVQLVQALALVAVVVFVVALFANEPDPVDRTPDPSGQADPAADGDDEVEGAAAVDGAAVFRSSCAGCHGAEGQGGSGPRLADGRVVERFPDVAEQVALVTDGRGGMPSFEGRLSEAEIQAVVDHTRSEL